MKYQYNDNKSRNEAGFFKDFDYSGIKKVEYSASSLDKRSYNYAFRVIRTPVSCRTFMIGGVDNKTIRELILDESGNPSIIEINCEYKIKVSSDFSLFNKTSSLFT